MTCAYGCKTRRPHTQSTVKQTVSKPPFRVAYSKAAEKVRNVRVRDIEADEVWSYIAKKEKRVELNDDPALGDAYVFVGIEGGPSLRNA